MDKQQLESIQTRLNLLQEELNKCYGSKKTPEQRFLELINGIDISHPKIDLGKYPDEIFWFDKQLKFMFNYDFKTGNFWVRYDIWKVFEVEFRMNYSETQQFIKKVVEKHFKLNGVTPSHMSVCGCVLVEEHFKLKDVTPKEMSNENGSVDKMYSPVIIGENGEFFNSGEYLFNKPKIEGKVIGYIEQEVFTGNRNQ